MDHRILKFRVWDDKYHCWDNTSLFLYPNTPLLKQGRTIQQFTGLIDSNGKEVYEGDIVRYRDKLAEIKYETDRGSFIIEWKWDKNQHSHDLTCDSAMECRVIGNIFENPELLK